MRATRLAVGFGVVAAFGGALGAAGGQAGERARVSGTALTLARGFSLTTYPRQGELSRVRLRFDGGYAIRPRRSSAAQRFGDYQLVVDGKELVFGTLVIPAGASGRRVELVGRRDTARQTRSTATLKGTLTTGTRPILVISGFPRGSTRLEFNTRGEGFRASRVTSPCRRRVRPVRGSMLLTLRGGAQLPGQVSPVPCGRPAGVQDETGSGSRR